MKKKKKKKKRRQICVFLVSSCCNLDYYDDVFIDNLGSIFNDHKTLIKFQNK